MTKLRQMFFILAASFCLLLFHSSDLDLYNLDSNSSDPVRIFRADELFSALHYSGDVGQTDTCWCSCPRFMQVLMRVCVSAEKCECREQSLTNRKLFCTMNYAFGKREEFSGCKVC